MIVSDVPAAVGNLCLDGFICAQGPLLGVDLVETVRQALRVRRCAPGEGCPRCHTWTASALVIAQSRFVREGIEAMLRTQPHWTVEAIGSHDGVADAVRRLQPDVVLLDSASAAPSAADAVRQLAASGGRTKIVVMEVAPSPEIVELIEAGASALLLQNSGSEEVVRTVLAVMVGVTVIPGGLASSLFSAIADRAVRTWRAQWKESQGVTRREYQV